MYPEESISVSISYPQAKRRRQSKRTLTFRPVKKYNRRSFSRTLSGNPPASILGIEHEKNLSAKSTQARPNTRLSCAHGDAQRTQGADVASRKGSRTHIALKTRPLGKSSDQGLPRPARLKRQGDFRRVFAHPTKSVDAYFTVLARRNDSRPARIGLAISKKHARRAVDRNRLKRIVRESFRQHRYLLHGIDFVVLCRHGALISPNSRLLFSLSMHWQHVWDQLCVGS